jgi:hypothetical protein
MKVSALILFLLVVIVSLTYCDNIEKYKQIISVVYKYADEDYTKMLPFFDSNVDWISYGPQNFTDVGYYKGHDGILKYFEDGAKEYTLTRFIVGPMIGENDMVTVMGEEEGNMVSTGFPFVNHWFHLFEFNNSTLLITRLVLNFSNRIFPTPPSV